MIVVGCVVCGRPWSSPCRSSRSRTRRASNLVTHGAGEVVLCLLRPVRGWAFWLPSKLDALAQSEGGRFSRRWAGRETSRWVSCMPSGMPIMCRGACVPNPSHLKELFFKYRFDFSITYVYLPIRLGVVRRGDAVVCSVFLQQHSQVRVVEVWAAVTDDGSRRTVSGEDTLCDESQNLPMVVCPSGDCLDPLGHIVHRHQYVLFPVRRWERSHEIYPPKVEDFHLKDRPHRHLISLGDVDRLTL